MTSANLQRQRGAYNLTMVALLSAGLAALAMAVLWSWRYEKNVFAEGAGKAGKLFQASPAQGALDSAKGALSAAAGQGDGKLRKCTIKGRTVISNEECLDSNSTTLVLQLTDTRGVEAPKAPPPPPAAAPGSNAMLDKAIEKQLQGR